MLGRRIKSPAVQVRDMAGGRAGAACGHAGWLAMGIALLAAGACGAAAGEAHNPVGDTQPFRGIVKAVHQAAISSDLATPVAALSFREGERFRQGDLLVEFDCARHRHDLEALAAQAREMHVAVEANAHLAKSGAANRNEVRTSEARYERAKAEHASVAQRLQRCRILAPFDGVVTELTIHAHEMPAANQPFITIVSDTVLEMEIIAPSRMVSVLNVGSVLHFTVDETGKSYPGSVLRTGGAVDPVSQTVKLYAGFTTVDAMVLPGMSGTASFVSAGMR
jgi:membrane fusion protein (multidrug efflux system)